MFVISGTIPLALVRPSYELFDNDDCGFLEPDQNTSSAWPPQVLVPDYEHPQVKHFLHLPGLQRWSCMSSTAE